MSSPRERRANALPGSPHAGRRGVEFPFDRVHLADVRCPFLTVLAKRDHIVPEPASAPLIELVGAPDKHELRLDAGHIGLIVGKTAARTTVPTIIDFMQLRSEVRTLCGRH